MSQKEMMLVSMVRVLVQVIVVVVIMVVVVVPAGGGSFFSSMMPTPAFCEGLSWSSSTAAWSSSSSFVSSVQPLTPLLPPQYVSPRPRRGTSTVALGSEMSRSSSSSTSSTTTPSSTNTNWMSMTDEEDRVLQEQGAQEARMMQAVPTALPPTLEPDFVPTTNTRRSSTTTTTTTTKNSSSISANRHSNYQYSQQQPQNTQHTNKKHPPTGTGGGFGGSGFGGTPKNKHKKKKTRKKNTTIKSRRVLETPTKMKQQGEGETVGTGAAVGGSVSPAVQHLIHTLQTDGVVRIDDVLADATCDAARDYVVALRDRATQELERPETPLQRHERFADVLVNQNRCDLKVPLGPEPVHTVLLELLNDNQQQQEQEENKENTTGDDTGAGKGAQLLQERASLVRDVLEGVFNSYPDSTGADATVWELNCFMSTTGARRQLVHADCVCLEPVVGLAQQPHPQHHHSSSAVTPTAGGAAAGEPILLTCFIALQDIDRAMGPTYFLPQTHTIDAHQRFFQTGRYASSDDDEDTAAAAETETEMDPTMTNTNTKNALLAASACCVGAPIPKGSCILFDPRVLHCAGANHCPDPTHTRAVLYLTLKNSKIDSPGCPSTSGYGIANADITLDELVTNLLNEQRLQQTTTATATATATTTTTKRPQTQLLMPKSGRNNILALLSSFP